MKVGSKVVLTPEKLDEISSTLTGYWKNDAWDITNSFFDDIRPEKWKATQKIINFDILPVALKDEVKFFYAKRLIERSMRLVSVASYSRCFSQLAEFLKHTYPHSRSFADLPIEKAMVKWRSHLVAQGMSINKDGRLASDYYETVLQQLYYFFEIYYDTRDEFEKDVWNLKNIPGGRYTHNSSDFLLNFKGVPKVFLDLGKRYIKARVCIFSRANCFTDLRSLRLFLSYINLIHPEWTDLQRLSRNDMESYLSWFSQHTAGLKERHRKYLIHLRTFIQYIQRAAYPEAPTIPVAQLIWKEDIPRLASKTEHSIKFIPEGVLRQLDDHMEKMEPEYIPIIGLLRASGWRISDILNLRYDTCLERTTQGWWLCGDILKTQVLNHRIPITDEVAAIVQSARELTIENSTNDNNPKKYLFVRFDGKRMGLPPQSLSIQNALNRLGEKYHIVDDQMRIYHFGNHAFRHTKGVELINNGMNILHVQKWMAHASPEMTLRYAKIHDTTMRKSWEEAMKNGAFRLDASGNPIKVDLSTIENEDVIEWEYIRHNLDAVRMPLGYCLKPKKLPCTHQLNPCLTCRNMCTTPDFIPQYETEIREVKALIERAAAQGQTIWVEKNQSLLEHYGTILAVLMGGKTHHLAGKKGREYVGEERNNV